MAFRQTKGANAAGKALSAAASSKAVRGIAAQIGYFAAGFMLSGGAVFGEYAPFGASAVAAVPNGRLFACTVGAVLGYMVTSKGGGFRYVATILAIAAIRWTLSDIKRINKSVVFPTLLSFVPMLATGAVLAAVGGYQPTLFAMCIIESVLAGIGGF